MGSDRQKNFVPQPGIKPQSLAIWASVITARPLRTPNCLPWHYDTNFSPHCYHHNWLQNPFHDDSEWRKNSFPLSLSSQCGRVFEDSHDGVALKSPTNILIKILFIKEINQVSKFLAGWFWQKAGFEPRISCSAFKYSNHYPTVLPVSMENFT